MRSTGLGLVLYTVCLFTFSQSYTFPANEYEFSIRRDSLKQAERIFEGKTNDLTEVCNSAINLATNNTNMTFDIYVLDLKSLVIHSFKVISVQCTPQLSRKSFLIEMQK